MLNSVLTFTSEQMEIINDFRNLLEGSGNLNVGTDDVFLSKFLADKNWNIEKAFGALHSYYNFKAEYPLWMAQHPVEYFRQEFFDAASRFVMPKPDKEGRPILVYKMSDVFHKYPNYLFDSIEIDDLIIESMMLLPQAQQNGITIIFDMRAFSRNFLPSLAPSYTRLINQKNKVLPFSKRVIHFIQGGAFMNAVASVFMTIFDREFKKNTVNHDGKDFDKLRSMIGYENLPAEYGGPPENQLDGNLLWNHLEKHADYLLKLQSYYKFKRN